MEKWHEWEQKRVTMLELMQEDVQNLGSGVEFIHSTSKWHHRPLRHFSEIYRCDGVRETAEGTYIHNTRD